MKLEKKKQHNHNTNKQEKKTLYAYVSKVKIYKSLGERISVSISFTLCKLKRCLLNHEAIIIIKFTLKHTSYTLTHTQTYNITNGFEPV